MKEQNTNRRAPIPTKVIKRGKVHTVAPIVIGQVEVAKPSRVFPHDVPAPLLPTQETSPAPVAPVQHVSDQETRKMDQESIQKELEAYRNSQLTEIEREKGALRENAYQEGFQKGVQDGEAAVKDKAVALLEAINQLAVDREATLHQSKRDILELSVRIAEKILQEELKTGRTACLAVIDEAIRKITDKDRVIIKVNPEEVDAVRKNRERFLNIMPDIKTLEVEEDTRLERGGCLIETKLGYVDSTIKTKLETLEKALLKSVEDEPQ